VRLDDYVQDKEGLKKLLKSGMNIMRVNCSHGDHELYERVITTARDVVREEDSRRHALLADANANVSLGIALDTKGPEIRLGVFGKDVKTPVEVPVGQVLRLFTSEKRRTKMTESDLFVDYPTLATTVVAGNKIFIDDGLLCLDVREFGKDEGTCGAGVGAAFADATRRLGTDPLQ
jgi:pyruvate kinase